MGETKEGDMGVLKMWRGRGEMIKDLNLVTAEFLWPKKEKKKKEKEKWENEAWIRHPIWV
jgi:hypothetical protein